MKDVASTLGQKLGSKLRDELKRAGSQKKDISEAELLVLKQQFNELEHEFSENLARIYNKGAHKSGVTGCLRLLKQYSEQPEVVGVLLKQLSNKNLLIVAKSASAGSFQFLAFHASLFGSMAVHFKRALKDTTKDVPPSLVKTVRRMVITIVDLFFQESHDTVRNACAISLREILENCFVGKRCGKGH